MKKVVFGVLLAVGVLAKEPVPSKVITVKPSYYTGYKGSIHVSESVPPDTFLFDDE